MLSSEDQFRELLAQLIGRADRMLAERHEIFPMGLLLRRDGTLDVSVAAYEEAEQIPGLLNAMQASLSEKAVAADAVAACIAFPDYDASELVAFLENRENYCAKARLPVLQQPAPHLDAERITIEEGAAHVFPADG